MKNTESYFVFVSAVFVRPKLNKLLTNISPPFLLKQTHFVVIDYIYDSLSIYKREENGGPVKKKKEEI